MNRVGNLSSIVKETIRSDQSIMVGGFGRGGTPFSLLEYIHDELDVSNLVIIKNDANEENLGVGMLIRKGMVSKIISTHIGLNPEAVRLMNERKLEVEFVPQGIFAERIRAGGSGIPAFLSDIAMGTTIAEGKPTVEWNGKELLIESALRADVALICADVVDTQGNCWWRGSNRNMSPMMGMAADTVIVEARKIVEPGAIEPENVHLPHAFVNHVVEAKPRRHIAEGRID